MKTQTLSKSDIKTLNARFLEEFGRELLSRKDMVQRVETEKHIFLRVNGEVRFFYHDDRLLPTLSYVHHDCFLKTVTVDMGAVRFVVSGADIMRPGITAIDDAIRTDDVVAVIDENNKKPLAIGIALQDAAEMKTSEKGNSIKNIHTVSDHIWKLA